MTVHLDRPVRLNGTHLATQPKDSSSDIANGVRNVLDYPYGYRLEAPEFGVVDQTFSKNGADLTELEDAIRENEPRALAAVQRLRQPPDDIADAVDKIRILIGGGDA